VAGESFFCDHNAGAPASEEVIAAYAAAARERMANPASAHAPGRRARAVLEEARQRIATAFDLAPVDVVFTSGCTEAANLAVLGLGDARLPVLLSAAEHPAVAEPAALRGIVEWELDATGTAMAVPPPRAVGLVCLVHAQSELGTLQPVGAAADVATQQHVPLFVDAAQSLGRVPLQPIVARGAIVALSPHKAGGLRGHGVLLGRDLHRQLRPLLRGGAQELGLRPGTQDPALAVANALAITRAIEEQPVRAAAMLRARDAFLTSVADTGVTHRVLTPLANSVPNTAMLCFAHVDGRNLVATLDLAGVHASHGSACSSGAVTPPRVLAALGLRDDDARACVRFSFDWRDDELRAREAGRRVGELVRARQKKI
jgi:cysteine desulfurase